MSNVKLITLMVLVITLVAGSALAGGDMKVYGKLHTSINMVNDGEDSQLGLSNNTSRFGIKGQSALNDDFTAIWQFESALDMANKGSNTLANRNSYVGVKGEFGTVLWGIHDTPFKTLGRKATFFFDTVGDNRQVMMHTDDRTDEYLMYVSPDFDGFGFRAGYEFDQAGIAAEDMASSFSGMAHYAKDEFFVGAAFETFTKGNFIDEMMPEPESEMRMRFAGKYDAEQFALAATVQMVSNHEGIEDWKSMTYGGEALFKATPEMNVKGGFYMFNPDTEELVGEDWGATLLTFGVDYNWTKSFQMYAQYATMMSQDNAGWSMGDYNGFGTTIDYASEELGESVFGFSVGTVLKF